MSKLKAAMIYQGYQLQTDSNTRLTVRDKRGEWSRWTDGAIGLSRYVVAITSGNQSIKQVKHRQVTDLRTHSHGHMNNWLERKTQSFDRNYGEQGKKARVVGDFASRTMLEERGVHVLSSGGPKPIEWIPIYIETAKKLRQAHIGEYVIKIDTDYEGNDPTSIGLLKAGTGHHETGYWDDFYHALDKGIAAFSAARELGHDLNPSHNAASLALNKFVDGYQSTASV